MYIIRREVRITALQVTLNFPGNVGMCQGLVLEDPIFPLYSLSSFSLPNPRLNVFCMLMNSPCMTTFQNTAQLSRPMHPTVHRRN